MNPTVDEVRAIFTEERDSRGMIGWNLVGPPEPLPSARPGWTIWVMGPEGAELKMKFFAETAAEVREQIARKLDEKRAQK